MLGTSRRPFDTETYDVANVPIVISSFLQRIDTLFLKRGCLTLVGTYTKYVIDLLQRPHTLCTNMAL